MMETIDIGHLKGSVSSEKSNLMALHEALFSLNIALTLTSAIILGGIFEPFVRLAGFLNQLIGRTYMNAAGGYAAFFALVLALAGLLVFAWRLLRPTPIMRPILVFGAGLVAVGASPACWFYIVHFQNLNHVYLIEAASSLVFATVYLARKWSVPVFATVFLLIIHYGFWGLRFWEYTHNPAELLIPAVGFLSCLVWTTYVQASRHSPAIMAA